MIILSDSEDFPWCRCDEEQAQAPVIIAMPAPSCRFEGAAIAFPRRLHDFFTVEELSRPAVPAVDAAQLARATYMCGWHARPRDACIRACVATCPMTRRSLRIAQRDL